MSAKLRVVGQFGVNIASVIDQPGHVWIVNMKLAHYQTPPLGSSDLSPFADWGDYRLPNRSCLGEDVAYGAFPPALFSNFLLDFAEPLYAVWNLGFPPTVASPRWLTVSSGSYRRECRRGRGPHQAVQMLTAIRCLA